MSLRTVMQRTATMAGRRFASSTAAVPKAPVPEMYQTYSFRKAFLEDPSTYPLIVVMATATSFIFGMSINGFSKNGVKITDAVKHEGYPAVNTPAEGDSLTKSIARKPRGFYAQSYKDIRQEGLGMDHNEWVKGKLEYDGIARE